MESGTRPAARVFDAYGRGSCSFARTLEMGAKGQAGFDAVSVDWSADVYGTRNQDDILFESSGLFIGSGYFANVGTTQRLGAEVAAAAKCISLSARFTVPFVRL